VHIGDCLKVRLLAKFSKRCHLGRPCNSGFPCLLGSFQYLPCIWVPSFFLRRYVLLVWKEIFFSLNWQTDSIHPPWRIFSYIQILHHASLQPVHPLHLQFIWFYQYHSGSLYHATWSYDWISTTIFNMGGCHLIDLLWTLLEASFGSFWFCTFIQGYILKQNHFIA